MTAETRAMRQGFFNAMHPIFVAVKTALVDGRGKNRRKMAKNGPSVITQYYNL